MTNRLRQTENSAREIAGRALSLRTAGESSEPSAPLSTTNRDDSDPVPVQDSTSSRKRKDVKGEKFGDDCYLLLGGSDDDVSDVVTNCRSSLVISWNDYSQVFRYDLKEKQVHTTPWDSQSCGCNPYTLCFDVLTDREKKALARLKHEASIMYDKKNEAHEKLLMQYWTTSFPDLPPVGNISPRWRSMGFQSHDPRTDFRGGSVLSLYCMVFFQAKYPKDFSLISNELWQFDEYPFSAGFINIVYMIILFLKLNSEPGYIHGGSEVASSKCLKGFANLAARDFGTFAYLFSSCCICLHNHWRKLSSKLQKRRLTDFADSMKFTKKCMIECLASKPLDVRELKRIYSFS